MDTSLLTIMRFVMFLAGIGAFGYVVLTKEKTGSAFLKMGFAVSLILVGVFADSLTSFKAGPQGFEFGFREIQTAAKQYVMKNPEVAESLTGASGETAIRRAVEMIEKTTSPEEIKQLLPYQLEKTSLTFTPRSQAPTRTFDLPEVKERMRSLSPLEPGRFQINGTE